ncbi:hypothetical protein [Moraxella lacunata]
MPRTNHARRHSHTVVSSPVYMSDVKWVSFVKAWVYAIRIRTYFLAQ